MSLSVCPQIRLLPPSCRFPRQRFLVRAARASAESLPEKNAAIVWFKHDLRIDDHSGLVAAVSQHPIVVPLYVFDRRIVSRFSDELLEMVLLALDDLRRLLKDQGSDLLIGFGNAEDVLLKLVEEVKATHIFAEEEVEYGLRRMVDIVEKSLLDASFSWGGPQFVSWQTPFYEIQNLKELPESHCEFLKLKIPVTSPLATPVLPSLDITLDRGALPTFDDLKRYLNKNTHDLDEGWTSIKSISAQTILRKEQINQAKIPGNPIEHYDKSDSVKTIETSATIKSASRKSPVKSVFISREGNLVGGGTGVVLNALAAYLRYLEGTARDDWQEVHEKLCSAESRNGASFHALFGSALSLGIISRRRVHYEAIKYEKERNAGFLSPFGYSAATVEAAVDSVKSMEWYWLMSLKSQKSNKGRHAIRIWRWNGYLIQYTVSGHEGPAILLVHGFGAFLEHYRDNIHEIAGRRNRVWAITLLGFGKSEKPNVVYTELVWAELLRDFIIEVVGEPAHVAGNSIGGYFVALVAGLWPALVKSVVLINTAGSVIPGYSSVQLAEVLILQGTKDPLSKSKMRLSMLKEHCSSSTVITELDAGHCPHDELPQEVNSIIQDWIGTIKNSLRPVEIV